MKVKNTKEKKICMSVITHGDVFAYKHFKYVYTLRSSSSSINQWKKIVVGSGKYEVQKWTWIISNFWLKAIIISIFYWQLKIMKLKSQKVFLATYSLHMYTMYSYNGIVKWVSA